MARPAPETVRSGRGPRRDYSAGMRPTAGARVSVLSTRSRHEEIKETTVTETPTARSSAAAAPTREQTGWVGWLIFAALMLILAGSFQAIDGLVALFKDEVYLVRPDGLVVNV